MNDIKSCIEESTKKIKGKITPKIAGEIAESCKTKFKKEETHVSVSKRKFTKLPIFGGWSWWFWVVIGLVGMSILLLGFASNLLFFVMLAWSVVIVSTFTHFKFPNLRWSWFVIFLVIILSILLTKLFIGYKIIASIL